MMPAPLPSKTLLEKALSEPMFKRPRVLSEPMFKRPTGGLEEAELALAWMNGKVNLSQIQKAIGFKSSNNTYNFLAIHLRSAFRLGLIAEVKK